MPPAPHTAAKARSAPFRKRHPTAFRAILLGVTLAIAFALGLAYSAWALVCRGGRCPSIEVLDEYTPKQTSKLYAADGRFIAELGLERRTLVKLGDIPQTVQNAFIYTEDKRFYSHSGVDWIGVLSALKDIARGKPRGASTITQQLAGNLFPAQINRGERTIVRKVKEARVAREIENRYSKAKILELYLNQINLGAGAYGVETAARRYFGKSVRDLNLAEAATLAALPKGPERYNPRRHPDRAIQRRNTVIELMRENGAITAADASLAKAYPLQLADKVEAGQTAPYFVEWIRQQLDAQFGRQLYEQGLKVYTTLDLDMQTAAERALERQLRAIEGGRFGAYKRLTYEQYVARIENGEQTATGTSPYLQGAFMAIDPRSGGIRAMVGGRDFYDSKFNRITQALRQPGSSFKPIVYSAAVQNGRPPSYIVDDSPISVPQPGGPPWEPQNYDFKFQGPMPMRRALYQSRNIVAVKVGQELGVQTVINEARNFGITTPIPPYPSIFIGAADVLPLEMIASFTTFANLGIRPQPNAIVRVENSRGEVLWQPTPTRTQVLSASEAWIMVDMMKDVIRRGTANGPVWQAGFTLPAGGKTGTTNDGTNVWFIGYTPDLVAGVWMGFDRPQNIKSNAQGGILAAPAWTTFMTEVYRRKPAPPDWPRPDGVTTREIDATSGLLYTPACPRATLVTEVFVAGTEPQGQCDPYGGIPGGMYPPGDSTAPPQVPPLAPIQPATPAPGLPRGTTP